MPQPEGVFASSEDVPDLMFPEGLTSWGDKVYVATFNVAAPTRSRIFVFSTSGRLIRTLGGVPGEELISAGPLLGLTIDPRTGDLYAAANSTQQVLRIRKPSTGQPQVSVYAQLPAGTGPEGLSFNAQGVLYVTDSNLGQVFAVPPGGSGATLVIGPDGSGAPIDSAGLFDSPIPGLAPNANGIVFSQDYRTMFIANLYADRIVAFRVNRNGEVTGKGRIFAQQRNPDLQLYPVNFEPLIEADTQIGPSAGAGINGPDGLALDSDGNIWAAAVLGDDLVVIDPESSDVIRTVGSSAATQDGLLNNPASMTFVGESVYVTNLGFFSDGTHGNPLLPWTVARLDAGVTGAGGNGNH
jgi:sugar lactone lactonase YvrE